MAKHYENKKARNCCGGSPLKGKGFQYVKNYAVCVSQNGINISLDTKTVFKYDIMEEDSTNAYSQDPPIDESLYIKFDNNRSAIQVWKCNNHVI